MSLNPKLLSDAMIRCLRPADRKRIGVATSDERQAKNEALRERDLQRLCEQELNRRGIPYLHLSHRARERAGWPDLVFPHPLDGRFVAVELKVPGGRVESEQVAELGRLAAAGARVAVCWSFDEFVEVLR